MIRPQDLIVLRVASLVLRGRAAILTAELGLYVQGQPVRQVIDRIVCEKCGRLYDFERLVLTGDTATARIEPLTSWLQSLGWEILPKIGSSFQTVDTCPDCVRLRK